MSMNFGSIYTNNPFAQTLCTPMPMFEPGYNNINIPNYYRSKYGCTDCFIKEPYWNEMTQPVIPQTVQKTSLIKHFFHSLIG